MKTGSPQSATGGKGYQFGTAPVFLASISTILGAIMILRFGYAVAHTGLAGALWIIVLGHLVTFPTAMAIAEIATNRRVEGGGEYFIISRSFGTTIGGTIGIALYLSQAVSVAFYMIAFAEAFQPLAPWLQTNFFLAFEPRMISLPAAFLLLGLVYLRGAKLGVSALWVVVGVLAVALTLFFLGSPTGGEEEMGRIGERMQDADPFILVFAIVFPAFTGMTAGVGLSGDLANPRRAIPLGILLATALGFVVYIAQVIKLSVSAPPELLAGDQLIMSRIALWGPIIPIGLGCATLSSAIGSILVAPRTLQAMARDRIVPFPRLNRFLGRGAGKTNEPRNATLLTAILVLIFVSLGSINVVARIISMFFMLTYGSLCAISFLEHFAARPGYRPSFRSRWYISLLGAIMCILMMFQMDPVFAVMSILIMGVLYRSIQAGGTGAIDDLAAIFRGVFTQATRYMQVKLQRSSSYWFTTDWRPSVIMVNERTFERTAPLQFLSWICHRYGFGTYLHFIKGQLNDETYRESRKVLAKLIRSTEHRGRGVFMDTMVSPSMRSALAQSLQVPGVTGMENNTILFEMSRHDEEKLLREIFEGCLMAGATRLNNLVLCHTDHFFGNRREIHLWLTWHDYQNANLMILLAYILLGHPDWRDAEISIFAAIPSGKAEEETTRLQELISGGRLPINERKIQIIPTDEDCDFPALVARRSGGADLVLLGFTLARLKEKGEKLFLRHKELKDILWVCAQERIQID
ncbi:MAG: amino acid permease [Acidobacteriota bacterium]